MNLFLGRKAKIVPASFDVDGSRVPAVAIWIRMNWIKKYMVRLDLVSFLVIADKLVNFKGPGPFHYDHEHEAGLKMVIDIPEWAIKELQWQAETVGKVIYEHLEKVDKGHEQFIKTMSDILPQEVVDKMKPANVGSVIERYRKLHAKVNGYAYIEGEQAKSIH